MMNHVSMMGRLVRDPELRRTGSGIAVASFRIAVDRDFSGGDGKEREADFFDCVAWRQTGEFISKYFTKGRMIAISGRLQSRNWNDKDGNKRTSIEIVVDNGYFADSAKQGGNNQGGNNYGAPQGGNNYGAPQGGNNYGAPQGGNNYGAPAQGGYNQGGNNYSVPGGNEYGGYPTYNNPGADFAMLDDSDAQLPF